MNNLQAKKAQLEAEIAKLQVELEQVNEEIKTEEAKALEDVKVKTVKSPVIEALQGIKELLEVKYSDAEVKNPTYYKKGDIDSTMHEYSLVAKLSNGKVLTFGVNVTYIPFMGATHEFTVTVDANNQTLGHQRVEVKKSDITVQGVKNILANSFKFNL